MIDETWREDFDLKKPAKPIGVVQFGEDLLQTLDLDPVYVMLKNKPLSKERLGRWLMAYWLFYHCGVASHMSEFGGDEYWKRMMTAVLETEPPLVGEGPHWPRAGERRHFRGLKAVTAINVLSKKGAPEEIIERIFQNEGSAPIPLDQVLPLITSMPQFGPWIAFKVADMAERVLGHRVLFPAAAITMYKIPRQALDLLVELEGGTVDDHYKSLLNHFKQFNAPPSFDRPCGPQEVETILCKWKSYQGGHYYVGKDLHEIRKGMQGWGKTAEYLLGGLPTLGTQQER